MIAKSRVLSTAVCLAAFFHSAGASDDSGWLTVSGVHETFTCKYGQRQCYDVAINSEDSLGQVKQKFCDYFSEKGYGELNVRDFMFLDQGKKMWENHFCFLGRGGYGLKGDRVMLVAPSEETKNLLRAYDAFKLGLFLHCDQATPEEKEVLGNLCTPFIELIEGGRVSIENLLIAEVFATLLAYEGSYLQKACSLFEQEILTSSKITELSPSIIRHVSHFDHREIEQSERPGILRAFLLELQRCY